jgi:hypothetical protein
MNVHDVLTIIDERIEELKSKIKFMTVLEHKLSAQIRINELQQLTQKIEEEHDRENDNSRGR